MGPWQNCQNTFGFEVTKMFETDHRLSATNLIVTFLPLVLFMSAFIIQKLYNSLQLAGRVSFVKKSQLAVFNNYLQAMLLLKGGFKKV
jgi:hypothetical protein